MTRRPLTADHVGQLTLLLMLFFVAVACMFVLHIAEQSVAAAGSVLRVQEDQDAIVEVTTRVRHTTVLVLPAGENILDFIVGDAEYWHLTGSAHVAFLKPLSQKAETNVALVCESGRIYSFLVAEQSEAEPHLIVRIERPQDEGVSQPGAHRPAFVARDQVTAYQQMAAQASEQARTARQSAQNQVQEARQDALTQIDGFREAYPRRLKFPYRLDKKAHDWPFLVSGMWHDGQFTYLRSTAQESPALYEVKDGKPSLVAYDLHEDGLYIARHVLGDGWLKIGKKRVTWKFNPKDLEP